MAARRRPWFAVLLATLLAVSAVAAVAASVVRAEDEAVAPAAVSPKELVALAHAGGTPVYWAGRLAGRQLELSTTEDGAFVRYLPGGTAAGSGTPALTIATYPVPDAYAGAKAGAKRKDMASRRTRNAGLAVWSRSRPTSVYVAWRGVPHLVEVYAPDAAAARRLALSGRIRPVR